jgi:hypothetical protein
MRYIFWLLLLTACSQERKVQRAIDVLSQEPSAASVFCSNKFPSKDTTIYKDSIVFLDTLYQISPADTVLREDTVVITKTSPTKTITKTIVQTKEIIRQPTEKIEEQRQLYLGCEKRYQTLYLKWEDAEKQRKTWKERFFWLLLLAAALLGFTFRKPLLKLIGQ